VKYGRTKKKAEAPITKFLREQREKEAKTLEKAKNKDSGSSRKGEDA